ncbi:fumarate hydratase [Mucilaginibacter sp. PAMB04168]|uniref:fumarate hydratase n=1 Tax=Mucilaginibacter sp. PAMB04168 TaxID=3138567 RepID=UPI0031F69119
MRKQLFILRISSLKLILAFGSCLLAFTSCSTNANLQGPGQVYLQGEWRQDKEPLDAQLLNYTLYRFKFSCDSFYVVMQTYSKVNYGADTCMNRGQWTEYAKGNYEERNDTLRLRGFFCNANYSLKDPGGCFRSGVYEDQFKTVKQSDSVITLTSTSGVLTSKLHLIKRTTCVPKPL